MTAMTEARHYAYIEADLESMRRGGSCRTAACLCGWKGHERGTLEIAADDALTHERDARAAEAGTPAGIAAEHARTYDKQRDICIGLDIFHRHGGALHVAAEHDIFYAGQGDGQALSDDDILTLYQSGWDQDPCSGCADEFTAPADLAPLNPRNAALGVPGDDDRHLRTCSEWSINV